MARKSGQRRPSGDFIWTFNVTARLMARKFQWSQTLRLDPIYLQCDRAFDGAEMAIESHGKPATQDLQCDRAFDGAEMPNL
ncbi:MAG: hypothetical protein M2R45_00429 [Verrucomicrobia subdivision 3 bacterium]|nr:hypothetical protein [Limisphaerales bacterium]MCS1413691.1 hypothetical protein [Limisphaerales bacterium]